MFKLSLIAIVATTLVGDVVLAKGRPSGGRETSKPESRGRSERATGERTQRAYTPESEAKRAEQAQRAMDRLGRVEAVSATTGERASDAILGRRARAATRTAPEAPVLPDAQVRETVLSLKERFNVDITEAKLRPILVRKPQFFNRLRNMIVETQETLMDCGSACLLPTDTRVTRLIKEYIEFESAMAESNTKLEPGDMAKTIREVVTLKRTVDGKWEASNAVEVMADALEFGITVKSYKGGLRLAFKKWGVPEEQIEMRVARAENCR